MDNPRLGALLVLIGGITYLAVGFLTLGSAVAGYLVRQIPIAPSQSVLLAPIPLYPTISSVVASIVEIVSASFVIRTARILAGGEPVEARNKAWKVTFAGVIGASAFFVSNEFAILSGTFFSYGYLDNLGSALFWGLVAIVAGVWFSFWGAEKTTSG